MIAKTNMVVTPTTPPSPSETNPPISAGEKPAINPPRIGTPANATTAATRLVSSTARITPMVRKPIRDNIDPDLSLNDSERSHTGALRRRCLDQECEAGHYSSPPSISHTLMRHGHRHRHTTPACRGRRRRCGRLHRRGPKAPRRPVLGQPHGARGRATTRGAAFRAHD